VAATQATGCRGVGVDISPDCIAAAAAMVAVEDAAGRGASTADATATTADEACAGRAEGFARGRLEVADRLAWVCGDCVVNPNLLVQLALEHRATVVYLCARSFPRNAGQRVPIVRSPYFLPNPIASSHQVRLPDTA
jgi:hypothetical protein